MNTDTKPATKPELTSEAGKAAQPSINGIESSLLPENLTQTREQRIASIAQHKEWDLVIVGGGITGAGILKLASQLKLNVLLVEQKDFAWGSSSRSSKMVHGGLRYMAQGQFKLTKESVVERQRLLQEGYPLVTKQSFAMSHYQGTFPSPWIFGQLLNCYDFIAGQKQHKYWPKTAYQGLVPFAEQDNLLGGTQFSDALTDDARLVLRLVQESLQLDGQAINYAKVTHIAKVTNTAEQNSGYQVSIAIDDKVLSVNAKVVVNACGAWSNQLGTSQTNINSTQKAQPKYYMRPLRGSHLVIANWRLPVASVVSIRHALDKRPVQIYPWQNVTIVGTTDVEHSDSLNNEARISQQEMDYLIAAIDQQFPEAKITEQDIISTFSGVRPVITSGKNTPPSKEKREHYIEQTNGLISVTGGKLTTFRLIAEQVIKRVCQQLHTPAKQAYLTAVKQAILSRYQGQALNELDDNISHQVQACYGQLSGVFVAQALASHCLPIRYSKHLWAELVWAAKYEQVQHLDDLLLRRTRLGNVLPNGGQTLLNEIKQLCLPALAWSEAKWQSEVVRYLKIWQANYSLPSGSPISAAASDINKS